MTSETIVPKMIVPYEWILENVGQEPMTIASKMISFRGEKVFRVGLKNYAVDPVLFLLAIDLNKIGMKVEDVKFGLQGSSIGPATMEEMMKENIGDGGSLQLFTATLEENVIGNCKIMFRICIGGTDPGYSYQLSDPIAKDQLWAALKNQQNMADVEFIVIDQNYLNIKTFPAHKAILAARSRVFADKFEKKLLVNVRYQIKIYDVDPLTVETFLHFIYTGELMGTLADEELLKLADHYQLTTLASLCKLALKNMDSIQMAKVRQRINGNTEALSDSKIMPEKETEIFFDRTTPTFRCTSTFQLSRDGNEQPKCVMQYQNENICVAYNIGETRFPLSKGNAYISYPEIHLSCAKHLRFGLKVEDVYCRDAGYSNWLKMESKYFQRNSELLLDFSAKSLVNISDLQSVPFDVKFISTIGNYYYEMMDEGWTKDLWLAATNKKFTDLTIYVRCDIVMEVHSVILCARSPVLNLTNLSKNEISNTARKSKIIYKFGAEFDVEVVENFLYFLYTGSLKSTDNVQQLSKLATMYQVETLKNVCQQLLNANPPVEDVTDYLFLL